MRNENNYQLETLINRYLDGLISDSEFEAAVSRLEHAIDIEGLRFFKDRVGRIEELYRQLEVPSVPEGYWETFAERVEGRLLDETSESAWDRILNVIIPTRWPSPAYRYAGALVSVVLVIIIGRSIMESGEMNYMPAVSIKEPQEHMRRDQRSVIGVDSISPPPTSSVESVMDTATATGRQSVSDQLTPEASAGSRAEQLDLEVSDLHQTAEKDKLKSETEIRLRNSTDQGAVDRFHDIEVPAEDKSREVTVTGEAAEEEPVESPEIASEGGGTAEVKSTAGKSEVPQRPDQDRSESHPEAVQKVIGTRDLTELGGPSSNAAFSGEDLEIPTQDSSRLYRSPGKSENVTMSMSLPMAVENPDSLRERLRGFEFAEAESTLTMVQFVEYSQTAEKLAKATNLRTDIDRAIDLINQLIENYPIENPGNWLNRREQLVKMLPESSEN